MTRGKMNLFLYLADLSSKIKGSEKQKEEDAGCGAWNLRWSGKDL
jgi:hypothetical protein